MTSKHTPTPWRVGDDGDTIYGPIGVYTGTIADCAPYGGDIYRRDFDLGKCNAAFIIRTVNSHDALVEACEAALKALSDPECAALNLGAFCVVASAQEKIEAALSKAKEVRTDDR